MCIGEIGSFDGLRTTLRPGENGILLKRLNKSYPVEKEEDIYRKSRLRPARRLLPEADIITGGE